MIRRAAKKRTNGQWSLSLSLSPIGIVSKQLLFVNIKPILRGLKDDTPESTELFLKLK